MTEANEYNVILVVLDTVRAKQLGLYGRDIDPMPNLSEFSEDATVFERAYTNAPWTLPAHASLFTGKLPSEHGCHGGSLGFTTDHQALAEAFSNLGYRTYGVSNNIWISDHFEFDDGFDEFYKEWQLFRSTREIGHISREKERDLTTSDLIKKLLRGNPLINVTNGLYAKFLYRRNDFGGKRTTRHLSSLVNDASEPFFLFVNYMEGHAPFIEHNCTSKFVPEEIDNIDRYTDLSGSSLEYHVGDTEISDAEFDIMESLYDGELNYLDCQLGRLFEAVRDDGQLSDSIVVIVGDHGENIGDHGLMAHRFSVHDTLLHVPLVIRHPEYGRGVRVADPVDFRDLYQWLTSDPSQTSPTTLPSEGPIVAEYLSTEATPEIRYDSFEFEGSEYDRRKIAVLNDEHKLIVSDDGTAQLYEYGGCPDFEINGEQITDPHVKSRLREFCTGFDWEETRTVDERDTVKEHLKKLGYMD
ncbi:sulfatase [Halopiger goleimassiliensis]|uniref:sulfatase n=1 Tax=Halopiger goleimassiliensis TaxID=1293048 RepID=UPI000677770B|nr:sulfatase [Halopiger goleimassiliensis]